MPRLSCIIIPALGNTESLETTLVSVLERRPDNCEVVVVLNAPYEDPYNLQGEIQFLQAPAKTDLISCLNLGISATQAPIVHLLASGLQVDEDWIGQALAHFSDPRVAAVTPTIYDANDRNHLLAAGVGYHRGGRKTICRSLPQTTEQNSLDAIGPLLKAAFFRRSALNGIGGLPVGVGEQLSDIDLALSLRYAGWRIELEPKCRVFATTVDALQASGFLAGLYAERLFWRHAYQLGLLRTVLTHFATASRDAIGSSPRWTISTHFLGRLAALFQRGHYGQYRQAIASACVDTATAESIRKDQQRQITTTNTSNIDDQRLRVDAAHKAAGPKESCQAAPARRQKNRR